MTYLIEFTPEAVEHLAQLTAPQKSSVLDAIEVQLKHEPTVETLVYYEAVAEARALVTIRAIGMKYRERIRIGRTWWQA